MSAVAMYSSPSGAEPWLAVPEVVAFQWKRPLPIDMCCLVQVQILSNSAFLSIWTEIIIP